jgi:hypothetical protein
MCGAPALAGQTVKRKVAWLGGVALRVGVDRMGKRARLTNRNRTISRKPIHAPDLARRMAELQALREMVRRAESRSDSEVRPLARIRRFV